MKTLKKWNKSSLKLSEFLSPCDEIDEDLFDEMAGVVSPQYFHNNLLQVGEAMRTDTFGVLMYESFSIVGDRYFYLGVLPEFKQ